jgi:hypothetical protein
MKALRIVVNTLVFALIMGCGGGQSSCPGDTPLHCSDGTCCPRGYPYSCGNGYCYQYGCPAGSPEIGVCNFKLAQIDADEIARIVPIISEEKAKMCVRGSEQTAVEIQ